MYEVIQGKRRYQLTEDGWLVGGAGIVAQPGEQKAYCLFMGSDLNEDFGTHLQTNCGCGHNIAKSDNPRNGSGPVVAEVIGWGKFIEGELGWRTEYMEIVGLEFNEQVPESLAQTVKERYYV